jgi:type IV secretory pathway TrbD component
LSLRRTPFFRVLHRPRLFLGGEREPTLMMAIVAAGLAVAGQMSRVYLHQVQYRSYYPARSRPYRGATKSPCAFYIVAGLIVTGLLYWML